MISNYSIVYLALVDIDQLFRFNYDINNANHMNNNYNSYKLCPADASPGGTLVYIRNNLSHKSRKRISYKSK